MQTLTNNLKEIEEKQIQVLKAFSEELNFQMQSDPLEELLSLELNEIVSLIKDSYNYYLEEENLKPGVAKIKALEEYTLWYYGDKEKELLLREAVNQYI